MRISDWSSDVCSSDLDIARNARGQSATLDKLPGHGGYGGFSVGARDRQYAGFVALLRQIGERPGEQLDLSYYFYISFAGLGQERLEDRKSTRLKSSH